MGEVGRPERQCRQCHNTSGQYPRRTDGCGAGQKARQAAEAGFDRAVAETGLSVERFRDVVRRYPRLKKALHVAPHRAGSTPADWVYEAAELANTTRRGRIVRGVVNGVKSVAAWAVERTKTAPETVLSVVKTTGIGAKELGEIVQERGPSS